LGSVKLSVEGNNKLSTASDFHFGAADINFGKRQMSVLEVDVTGGVKKGNFSEVNDTGVRKI